MSTPAPAERLEVYHRLAADVCGQFVAIRFVPGLRSFSGTKCDGLARWSGRGHYEILLDADLSPERESYTAAHEIAHVKCKHPAQIAPTYAARIIQQRAAQGQKTVTERGDAPEVWAEVLGKILLAKWKINRDITW